MSKTIKPTIAGWLDIAAGIIWLFVLVFSVLIVVGLAVGFSTTTGFHWFRIWLLFIGLALPAILAILGGAFSIARRRWGLALIGSVCALPLGLGIIALVLLLQSRKAFT